MYHSWEKRQVRTCLPEALFVKPGGLRMLFAFEERFGGGDSMSCSHLGCRVFNDDIVKTVEWNFGQ